MDGQGPSRQRLVLVPRPRDRAAALAELLRAGGLTPIVEPVVAQIPPDDPEPLHEAVRALTAGVYPWAAVTSTAGADSIASAVGRLDLTGPRDLAGGHDLRGSLDLAGPREGSGDPAGGRTSWAAVGPATARAVRSFGGQVRLIPTTRSAAGLVAAFRDVAPSRILLALGDLAGPTLADGLSALGWSPTVVTAYRTVSVTLPQGVRSAWEAGSVAAVVLTSGSVARQVAAQLGPRPDVAGIAIGEPTARAARAVGLRVDVVTNEASDEALAAGVRLAAWHS